MGCSGRYLMGGVVCFVCYESLRVMWECILDRGGYAVWDASVHSLYPEGDDPAGGYEIVGIWDMHVDDRRWGVRLSGENVLEEPVYMHVVERVAGGLILSGLVSFGLPLLECDMGQPEGPGPADQ